MMDSYREVSELLENRQKDAYTVEKYRMVKKVTLRQTNSTLKLFKLVYNSKKGLESPPSPQNVNVVVHRIVA